MKRSNTRSVLLFVIEIVVITGIGVLLYTLNLSVWFNLIICILLMLEVLWVSKLTYNNDNTNTKFMTRISFVLMGIGYGVCMPVNILIDIPGVLGATYLILQGHLLMTGCINVVKRGDKDAHGIKSTGTLMYVLTIVLAFLSLFGIIK